MYLLIIFFIIGLFWGSFLALMTYRIPKNISIIRPGSFCDYCKNKIKFYNNIPILSYFILKAKCPTCKNPISLRYLFIELLTGLLFAFMYVYIFTDVYSLIRTVILITAIVPSVFIDFDEMIIPDRFSIGLIVCGFILSIFDPMMSVKQSLIGIIIGGGVLYLIALLYYYISGNHGLGGGDIKLFAGIGSITGWYGVLNIMFYSSIIGSVFGVIFLIVRKKNRQTPIPYGPFIGITALLYYYLTESGVPLF